MSPMRVRRPRLLGHLLFWPALAVWTWRLVVPNPVPESVLELLSWLQIAQYIAAKTLHLLGYTYLTVTLGLWVPCRRRPLLLALTLMLLHGLATEVIQTIVPGRSGRSLDVLIDWTGVTLGVLVGWRFWRPVFGYRDAITPSETR